MSDAQPDASAAPPAQAAEAETAAPEAAAPRSSADASAAANGTIPSASSGDLIIGVAVVDFNHLVGPQVEYAFPRLLQQDEDLCANLPFLALPDGSHLVSASRISSCAPLLIFWTTVG